MKIVKHMINMQINRWLHITLHIHYILYYILFNYNPYKLGLPGLLTNCSQLQKH